MVDYSKWDKMSYDISDSDDDQNAIVTKLDKASSVTIGPQGAFVQPNEKMTDSESRKDDHSISYVELRNEIPAAWTNNGANVLDSLYWTQSRNEVTIRWRINTILKAKDLSVRYSTKNSHSHRFLEVFVQDISICGGELQYDIVLPNEEASNTNSFISLSDWEIINYSEYRFVELTIQKKTIPGTTIWWDRVFVSDPPIDTTLISGRDMKNKIGEDVWKKAHESFRENIANKKPYILSNDEEMVSEP